MKIIPFAVTLLAVVTAAKAQTFIPLTQSVPVGSTSELTAPFVTSPTLGLTASMLTSMQEIEAGAGQSTVRVNALGSSGTMWDMVAYDPTGRYVFIPHETQYGAGLTRYDTITDSAVRLFQGDGLGNGSSNYATGGFRATDYGALDPAVWNPYNGNVIVAEEWSGNGRLFEIANPTTVGQDLATPIFRDHIPSVSHEGLKFDSSGNMYFVDEFASGSIYKFVPTTPGDLSSGQSFALKVGAGGVDGAAGAATWVPITDATGTAAFSGLTTNPFDFTNRGGRATADEVLATGYNRPEDLEIGTLANGKQVLYFAATGTNSVYSIELTDPSNAQVNLMANASTVKNLGSPGTTGTLGAPDNLAIDANGNLFVIEDNPNGGSTGGDVWLLRDSNRDGIAESLDHFMSLSVAGSEGTGMIFHPTDPTKFIIAVQHPNSTGSSPGSATPGDALWQFSGYNPNVVPEPSRAVLVLLGALGMCFRRRRA